MEGCIEREPALQAALPAEAYDRWLTEDGETATLFCRTAAGYLVRFPELADFGIEAGGSMVSCTPVPGVPEAVVTALYYNQIKPLLQNLAGGLVLHGSAVACEGRALAFLGGSGRGKSTLAAGFARAGYPFLTDDGVVLEEAGPGHLVIPNQPFVRLRPDSEAAVLDSCLIERGDTLKNRVGSGPDLPFQHDPLPLGALYFIGEGQVGDIVIDPMAQAAVLSALMRHSFILDVENRGRLRTQFDRLARLAETVDCFALDYPRRYTQLPQVIAALLAHGTHSGGRLGQANG